MNCNQTVYFVRTHAALLIMFSKWGIISRLLSLAVILLTCNISHCLFFKGYIFNLDP